MLAAQAHAKLFNQLTALVLRQQLERDAQPVGGDVPEAEAVTLDFTVQGGFRFGFISTC